MSRLLLLLFVIVGLSACKTIEIDPPAPEFQFVDEYSPPSPSFLSIQTELFLKPYLLEADLSLDNKFSGEDKQCEGISYKYNFDRDPIIFTLKGNEVLSEIDGKFDLSLSYCPDCHDLFGGPSCLIPRIYASCGVGEPKRKVHISYASKIAISENFGLHSQTKLKDFELRDPCKITVFQYDATPTIEKEVLKSLIELEKEIDKQLALAPVRQTMKDVWAALQQPILVAPYGYFYLRPTGIGIQDFTLRNDGQKALFITQLTAQPVFSTNELPLPNTALPPNKPQVNAANKSVFNLRTIASFDSINQFLIRDFEKQELKINSTKSINIDQIQVLGPQGERLVLSVAFSGAKNGVLYLVVKPYIDVQQHFRIREVDYELKTKSVLLHSAKWLLNSKLKEQIEASVDVDLSPLLQDTKQAVEQQINGEITTGVWLQGKIDALKVDNLVLTSGHLIIDVRLEGDLKLKIK
ncbi:MAG: DUF4403 family protein [Flavobacteriales bacterium]